MIKAIGSSHSSVVFLGGIFIAIAAVSALSWGYLPSADPDSYFHFADQRMGFGIPNFNDVVSNIFYLYISVFAIALAWKKRAALNSRILETFLVMICAIFFTAWGSSYFHMFPERQNLFWDRLPMAFAFASLLTLVITDRVLSRGHRLWLLGLNLLGFWSVWDIYFGSQDIRPYVIVQFGSLIAILLMLLLFPYGHIRRRYFFIALFFYVLAKAFEMNDHLLFELTADVASGHTLKHLSSALAIAILSFGVLTSRRTNAKTKTFS